MQVAWYMYSFLTAVFAQQDDEPCHGKQAASKKFCYDFANTDQSQCESIYLSRKDSSGYVKRCAWNDKTTNPKHKCKASKKNTCKPFDWSTARVAKGKKCSKELWTIRQKRHTDAEQQCDLEAKCKGIMFFNRNGEEDGRRAQSGMFKGCAGDVASVAHGQVI